MWDSGLGIWGRTSPHIYCPSTTATVQDCLFPISACIITGPCQNLNIVVVAGTTPPRCGLEDCGELVALATPEQLTRVFDLDLWRAEKPGRDEQFDADRFGVWLEVLMESGASLAQKLATMDADLVT